MLRRRPDIPFHRIILLFVAFIVLCGTTHLIDAIIFWWPAYRLSAFIRALTGLVSVITVYALYKIMPVVFSLRSVDELEHEISERKAVETKLLASEFLLEEAGRIGRMGGWEFDLATQRSSWSQTVFDIYELPYDFDIESADPYSFFAEPYGNQMSDAVKTAYATGKGWDLELQMITAKGNRIWVRSHGETFHDEKGKLLKLRGIFMDIDKYKLNELALHQSHDQLAQSHQQLKSFTHILSHNIRNHASNITLLTDLVEAESLNENNQDIFNKITTVSRGLNSTLNDLAKAIQIKESVVTPEALLFTDTIKHIQQMMAAELRANKADVITDFKVDNIFYAKLYLESVLMNLVSNSIKYRQEDLAPRIEIHTFMDDEGRTILEYTDNGIGIDLKLHADKIFGLYKTFHEHKDAHGIGLFLVKTQIESQGGNIAVKSQPGVGTTFIIKF
jgi:signal transduction histidine kinase